MPWTYRCENGHERGVFSAYRDARRARMTRCEDCGARARLRRYEVEGAQFIPDVPNHYNIAFESEVRGRRHLKQLQKEHGTQDYEPIKSGPQVEWRKKFQRQGRKIA